ncbi:hypothetical protein BKA70DRAFT_1431023 [Coprinopsis sp. MPI-PUGE-AT-0042]|nr:hypothetical protein BKA70DRAFT_1431023 [Coprinopsis sp. MPI-PUGE-AT-0042]
MTTHSPHTSKTLRRSGQPHWPPAKCRETASNPFVASTKLQKLRTSSSKAGSSGYHLSSPIHAGSPVGLDTPTKVKVEGSTPFRGLFSSPSTARDADSTTKVEEPLDIVFSDEMRDHRKSDNGDHQPAGTDCEHGHPSSPSSQVFGDGVGQPDEWAFWPPAPSSDNLAAVVEHTSDIEETSRSQGMFTTSPPYEWC